MFLTFHGVNCWNMLPNNMVEAFTPNAIKSKLEELWKQYQQIQKPMHMDLSPMSHRDKRPYKLK